MNQVKRAIIMAAGKGTRLKKLTETVPKPLVSVRGTTFIENIINVLHQNGIYEIYIVTGYKQEQFQRLPIQYPGITLIYNPYYETCNNISSLYVARDYLKDVVILDGDQWISNSAILTPTFKKSGYVATWQKEESKECILEVMNDEVISCKRNGGKSGWRLWSVSFWTKHDGTLLKSFVEEDFRRKSNQQLYWDDIALFLHPNEFKLGIRPVSDDDLTEIDSVDDLISFAPEYAVFYTK